MGIEMLDKIKQLISGKNSKNFHRIFKNYPNILEFLETSTVIYNPKNLNEQLYIVLNNPPLLKSCGKYPQFNTFELGYRDFCGNKVTCACARTYQSEKISENYKKLREKNPKPVKEKSIIIKPKPAKIFKKVKKQKIIPQSNSHIDVDSSQESILLEEIAAWLSDNSIDFKRNVKIETKTVDFLIQNIAIEFNGLYTHSQYSHYGKQLGIDRYYHYNKWKNCKNLNIQLLTIFEDEWIDKKQIIKNKILILLNRGNRGLPARKLKVELIDFDSANLFLEKYHIQGGTNATYYIGAFEQDRLVSVLTLKHVKEKTYDLNRFCSDEYMHTGIFSKLLSFAEKNLDIDEIISFSDNRYSDGKLYRNNNFVVDSEVIPDYFVTNYRIREHKFNWRKSRIKSRFNCDIENKTELDLTLELGWDRIWDCGKIKWKKLTKK
jgi:hypothetical protein